MLIYPNGLTDDASVHGLGSRRRPHIRCCADRSCDRGIPGCTGQAENALTPVVIEGLWAALPVALILLSYVLTAARERQAGIRRQRGALAALTGLAALSVPFFWSVIFTPVYGIAVVLLAIRTRYTPTAAFGALTLFASLYVGFLTVPQAVFLVALLAVAGAANTIRTWRASGGTSR